jgi:hypothetical protein
MPTSTDEDIPAADSNDEVPIMNFVHRDSDEECMIVRLKRRCLHCDVEDGMCYHGCICLGTYNLENADKYFFSFFNI